MKEMNMDKAFLNMPEDVKIEDIDKTTKLGQLISKMTTRAQEIGKQKDAV